MRLSFGQEMRLAQKQILAPRMIQSMEILQLPIMALQERIEQEMEENPILELREEDREESEEPPADLGEEEENLPPDAPTEEERELVIQEDSSNEDDFERLMKMDEEWPDAFDEQSRPSRGEIEEEGRRKHDAMANMTARPQTLQDYLHDQLAWFELDDALRALAERIIYNLDANGYLQGSLDDLLGPQATAEDRALARRALALVQKLDPPGVGARDLKECLLLQITPAHPHYEALVRLINDHLEDLEHNRLPAIARRTGVTLEFIQELLGDLRRLNPKPGAEFSSEFVPSVTPDVFIEPAEEGGFEVRLEEGRVPNLYISPYYRKLLSDAATTSETREYIKRKVNSAQWLIDSIEQRRNTLRRVAAAIVQHQRAFLEQGPEHIEPLKMQQIADKVGVHVTTVSRAVDDKWVQTPRGIFPLRRFFCSGTTAADGEEITWDAVRMKLQEIIDREDKRRPLNDEELKVAMAKEGINIARRTITKYRKAMNIPPARERRDWTLEEQQS